MSKKQIIILGIVVLLVVVLITMNDVKRATSENYEREFQSRCPYSYRIFDDTNIDLPAGRDRCRVVCNYDPSRYEFYCPHNARQYGVSLCDQGTMM